LVNGIVLYSCTNSRTTGLSEGICSTTAEKERTNYGRYNNSSQGTSSNTGGKTNNA